MRMSALSLPGFAFLSHDLHVAPQAFALAFSFLLVQLATWELALQGHKAKYMLMASNWAGCSLNSYFRQRRA